MPVVGSVFEKPLDDDVYGLQNALAIIVNGDTAPSALSQGKYIYLINHSTIRSGLYRIISAIASGDTIVSTDIETVPDGIINSLIEADGAKIDKTDIVNNLTTNDSTKVLSAAQGYALNSNLAPLIEPVSSYTAINVLNCDSWNGSMYKRIGNVVYIRFSVKNLTANTNIVIANLPQDAKPVIDLEFDGFGGLAYLNHAHFKITEAGVVNVYSADTYATGWISYPGK